MNREEIMKALECCGAYDHGKPCKECPYMQIELADDEVCSNRMAQDALALIKELTRENEMLSRRQVRTDKKMLKAILNIVVDDNMLRELGIDAEHRNQWIDEITKEAD